MKTSWLRNNGVYCYYAILLVVMLQWTNQTIAPPMALRLAFVAAVFVPLWFMKQWMLPAVMLCFYSIACYNYAYSYMPTELYIYFIALLIGLIFNLNRKKLYLGKQLGNTLIFFTFLVVFINILTSFKMENISYCLLILLMLRQFTSNEIEKGIKSFEICFLVITAVLSVKFLLSGSMFIETYDTRSGLERTGWTDNNYFGMVLGMGTIVAFNKFFDKSNRRRLITTIGLIVLVVVSLAALGLNASRGAILSVGVSMVIILSTSKVKLFYKIFAFVLFACVVVFLYTNNYFELLLYRIENDDGTGSGRTTIWITKLNAFIKDGNLLNWLIGMGYRNAFSLGWSGRMIGFHNDYIALFIGYGIVGLILFLLLLALPCKNITKEGRPFVYTLIIYLAVCLFTLEPLSSGLMTYYGFYYYILLVSLSNKRTDNLVINK